MNPKILVIGATGTIGGSVCDFLTAEKADFVALVRNEEKANKLRLKGIKTVIGDLGDTGSLQTAMDGFDKLFLLSVTSPDIPVLHGDAARIAKEKSIKHIVKISVRGAATDANFNIGRYHGNAEKEIREIGIPFTFLQPHSFMQNLLFERQTIKEKNAIYASMGNGKIPMIDTRDIAAVAVKTLLENGHEGKSYILTGQEAISYHDIVAGLSKVLNREIKYIDQTPEESYRTMMSWGMPQWLMDDMVNLNRDYAANKATEVDPAVGQILGRKPINLQNFIHDFADHFR